MEIDFNLSIIAIYIYAQSINEHMHVRVIIDINGKTN
jgi:hypothetical protein